MAGSGGTKACRLCLVTDSYLLAVDIQLENSMKSILGQNISYESGLPKYACYECAAFLKSFKEFREKCLIAQTVLYNILKSAGQVTEKEIKKLNRRRLNLIRSTPLLSREDLSSASHQDEEPRQIELVNVKEEPELEMDVEEQSEAGNEDEDRDQDKDESEDEDRSNGEIPFETDSEVALKTCNPLEEHPNIKKESPLSAEEADMCEGFTVSVPPLLTLSEVHSAYHCDECCRGAAGEDAECTCDAGGCQFEFDSAEEYRDHGAEHRTYTCRNCSFSASNVFHNGRQKRNQTAEESLDVNLIIDIDENITQSEISSEVGEVNNDKNNAKNAASSDESNIQILCRDNEKTYVNNTKNVASTDESNIQVLSRDKEKTHVNKTKNVTSTDESNIQVLSRDKEKTYVNNTKNVASTDGNNIQALSRDKEKTHVNKTKNVASTDESNIEVLSIDQDKTHVALNDVQGTLSEDTVTISSSDLLKIVQENNALQTENKALKEELLQSVEFRNETRKNFATMQTQMDRIINLLQIKNSSVHESSLSQSGDDIGNMKFPIDTKEQLDALEDKLIEKDVMIYLVKKFSDTCGTSGVARLSKVGLPLMQRFIKDELLNKFTWKGIKGTTKMAFFQYVRIRDLFYKVAHLADRSCSLSDSDSFIQNSALKHSGQRMKRQILSSVSKTNAKRTKEEINIID